jgi:hypothetical protein
MTVTAKCLVESTQLTASQTTLYTATGLRAILDKFSATNISGSAATVTVNLVPSGGSAGGTNPIVSAKSLQAGESYGFPELVGHVLNQGGFVSVLAGTASAINLRISGREVTQ